MSQRQEISASVGDFVSLRDRVTHAPTSNRFKVVGVTTARFRCDIGVNSETGGRMFQDYRKRDGRSVGNRHHVTFVAPIERKVCTICERAPKKSMWICRACDRQTCEHFCGFKSNTGGMATCSRCIK